MKDKVITSEVKVDFEERKETLEELEEIVKLLNMNEKQKEKYLKRQEELKEKETE